MMSEIKCPHCGANEDYVIEEFPLSLPHYATNRHFNCNLCGHCWTKKSETGVKLMSDWTYNERSILRPNTNGEYSRVPIAEVFGLLMDREAEYDRHERTKAQLARARELNTKLQQELANYMMDFDLTNNEAQQAINALERLEDEYPADTYVGSLAREALEGVPDNDDEAFD